MITLASDFPSPYPAAMKGVIASRSDARIEDIAHDFPRQDVRAAAFWLREVAPYFPPATHCVVVDPGVGTDRAAVVVEAGDHQFVAPDNGVAVPVARHLTAAPEEELRVWRYDYEDDETASNTFHGRDVFAPAAAEVHEADTVGFGNAITNVPGETVTDVSAVEVNGERVPVREAYAELAVGDRLVTVGSHGNVELAVNQGRGDDVFGVGVGDRISLEW